MSSQELAIYIRNEIESNTPKDKIIEHLKSAGWQDADIEKAFSLVDKLPSSSLASSVFPDLRPRSRHTHHFGQWLGTLLILIVLAFAAFSILFNMGLMGPPQLLLETSQNGLQNPEQNYAITAATSSNATSSESVPQNGTQGEIATATSSNIINATSSKATASGVASSSTAVVPLALSTNDKNQIIAAILTQGAVLQSGNATNIRDYLEATASSTHLQQLQAMSDSGILSLASAMTANESDITADALNSAQTTWQQTSVSSVEVTIQTSSGPVSRTANEVNGVWY